MASCPSASRLVLLRSPPPSPLLARSLRLRDALLIAKRRADPGGGLLDHPDLLGRHRHGDGSADQLDQVGEWQGRRVGTTVVWG